MTPLTTAFTRRSARLDGRVAMITGAARGMGRTHALLMAERGADIIAVDFLADEAEETCELVRQNGRKARLVAVDVADLPKMLQGTAEAEKEFGRVDILVHNAGQATRRGGLESVDEASFDRMVNQHFKAPFFLTQQVVRGMKDRRYGKIINISSTMALTGLTFGHPYAGAKAALLALTKGWAKEFAPFNICVNAVAPGSVLTKMVLDLDGMEKINEKARAIPAKRYADPEEISYTVAFLASDEADYITGQVISPNGGAVIV